MALTKNNPAFGVVYINADTFDELRDVPTTDIPTGASAIVNGCLLPADGLGGLFTWVEGLTDPDDDETTLAPSDGQPGRWSKIAVGQVGSQGVAGIAGPAGVAGVAGPIGPAGTVSIGMVATGAPGSAASVSNIGTANAAILNFSIPAGAMGQTGPIGATGSKGDTGAQGLQGMQGVQGPQGVQGVAGPKGDLGVPSGGATGQILGKASGNDFDVSWITATNYVAGSGLSLTGATFSVDSTIATVSALNTGLAGKANAVHTHDASAIISGTIDAARLPATSFQAPVVSSGDLTALTPSQQSSIAAGTVVITADGYMRFYTGAGDKTANTSYIIGADSTPDYSTITNRPTLGTAAAVNTGSSGHVLPFLDAANTFSANQTINGILTVNMSGSNYASFNNGAAAATPGLAIGGSGGKSLALSAGTNGTAFVFDQTGSFSIVADTKSNIDAGNAGMGSNLLTLSSAGNLTITGSLSAPSATVTGTLTTNTLNMKAGATLYADGGGGWSVVNAAGSFRYGGFQSVASGTYLDSYSALNFRDNTGANTWATLTSSGLSIAGSLTVNSATIAGTITAGAFAGNASSASKLAGTRTLGITGDLVWTSPAFDGSASVSATGTLATVNSNVGTYGAAGSLSVPVVTVNAKGLVTAASSYTLGSAAGAATGTTGHVVPYLDGVNTWSGAQTFGTISATNFSGSSSGTNTGDQVNISGNAATANSVAWTGVTGKPSTIAGFGITDAPTVTGSGASGTWAISISGSAATANATAWSGVTGKPSTISGFGITDAATSTGGNASGNWNINISGTAAQASSVAWANVSGKPFNYSGQSGQPSWLWGTNDGSTYYVWNPSNFNVNYASSAGSAGSVAWSGVTSRPTTLGGFGITDGASISSANTFNGTQETLGTVQSNNNGYNFTTVAGNRRTFFHNDSNNFYLLFSDDAGSTSAARTASFNSYRPMRVDWNGNINFNAEGSSDAYFGRNVYVSGNVQAASDARKKRNVRTIDDASAKVRAMRGVWFDWLTTGKASAGVIAQELEAVAPELVETSEEGDKTVNYNGLIGYLIEDNRALDARLAAIEERLQ